MSLFVQASDIENREGPMIGGARLDIQMIYGDCADMMVAERFGGYHSRPHTHDSEQLNLLVAGELWIFVENEAYKLRPGDFLRVPRGAIHWAWNTGDEICRLIEAHSPGLHASPSVAKIGVPLYRDDETPNPTANPRSYFIDVAAHNIDLDVVERAAREEWQERQAASEG